MKLGNRAYAYYTYSPLSKDEQGRGRAKGLWLRGQVGAESEWVGVRVCKCVCVCQPGRYVYAYICVFPFLYDFNVLQI